MAAIEEPMLSRVNRLDIILKHLEENRSLSHSPKSSTASTFSSGYLTSDVDHASSLECSPKSLEKHCRPINDVMMEVERKGTLIERLMHLEDRVLKVCLQLEEELDKEKHREWQQKEFRSSSGKKSPAKGLKRLVASCVKGKGMDKHKS